MPDGGTKEDFSHIANTLAELIQSNKITPVILVGIENTQRRRDLTGKTEVEEDKKIAPIVGGSTEFRAFVKDELFPEINKRYRTTNKKGIIGESLAGLFVIETFLEQPDMFDVYIAINSATYQVLLQNGPDVKFIRPQQGWQAKLHFKLFSIE